MFDYSIGILESRFFSDNALKQLNSIGKVYLYTNDVPLKEFVKDKDVLFVRLKYMINDEVIKNSKVRYICSPTTGLNHINVKSNVEVISLKNEINFLENIRATPEHILGLTIALLRNYKFSFSDKALRNWNREDFIGNEIYNNSVGIIGFGRIGKLLSHYFNALGAKIYYYDIKKIKLEEKKSIIKSESIEEVIKKTNIIILSVNYSDEFKLFFDGKYFDMLKGKFFINASRGELIDESALLKFIDSNKFKGIALDVVSNETSSEIIRKKLLNYTSKNVIVTPHIGGITFESIHKTEEFITEKLIAKLIN